MTTNELIKRLRNCAGHDEIPYCEECPFRTNHTTCIENMMLEAASYLDNYRNRVMEQATIITEVRGEYYEQIGVIESLKIRLAETTAELNRCRNIIEKTFSI
ncbi:MAG: hypothetical protein NC215_00325 [Ruminococcus sp.]|nr:hypothetical protein [Ruminococcus sp.]